MVTFDWNIWSSNFPVSFKLDEAMPQFNMPETIRISRAGHDVDLSIEEVRDMVALMTEAGVL